MPYFPFYISVCYLIISLFSITIFFDFSNRWKSYFILNITSLFKLSLSISLMQIHTFHSWHKIRHEIRLIDLILFFSLFSTVLVLYNIFFLFCSKCFSDSYVCTEYFYIVLCINIFLFCSAKVLCLFATAFLHLFFLVQHPCKTISFCWDKGLLFFIG